MAASSNWATRMTPTTTTAAAKQAAKPTPTVEKRPVVPPFYGMFSSTSLAQHDLN
jgi:hypothetical protein